MAGDMLSEHRQRSVCRISEFFDSRPGSRVLNSHERQRLRDNGFKETSAAWETVLRTGGDEIRAIVIIDGEFPFSKPQVIVSKEYYSKCPHVERSGALCLIPEQATFSHFRIVEAMTSLLANAEILLEDGLEGRNRDDFVSEFQSYWPGLDFSKAPSLISLIEPAPPSQLVHVLKNGRRWILSGNLDEGRKWLNGLKNEYITTGNAKAFFLWLPAPLFPEDYPNKGADIKRIASSVSGETFSSLLQALPRDGNPLTVIIGFDTANGPALGGAIVHPLRNKHGGLALSGFRKGNVPAKLLGNLFLGGNPVIRIPVQRADASWIHTRGGNRESQALSGKRVCIIGCGALGGEAARLLAKSGIRNLLLIDGDILTWDNIGRHELGAESIGLHKEEALARHLKRQLPHMEVQYYSGLRWQEIFRKTPDLFNEYDAIISVTADWTSDALLNRICRKSPRFPPVIFGWFEAHGCAGHALAVMEIGGCLLCGSDDTGHFSRQATSWDGVETGRRVPLCGVYYQPYGVVETTPIKAMVVETAIDVLLGRVDRSELRTWIGSRTILNENGGRWSEKWVKSHGDPGAGKILVKESWRIHAVCPFCQ